MFPIAQKVFRLVISAFVERYKDMQITVVAGIESRGFIFAAPIALGLKVPFTPLRKPGKLPCESVGIDIKSRGDFGKDRLECMEKGFRQGDRVLVIDDMLGSGKTLMGACDLTAMFGAQVVECAVVTELKGMRGRENLQDMKVYVLLEDAVS